MNRSSDTETATGVAIAGDGPVGLVLALALSRAGVEPLLIGDAGPAPDRPIALSHGSWLLLAQLGVLEGLNATPILTIHVSQQGGFGRTLIRATDCGLSALGQVVSYRLLVEKLRAALRSRLRSHGAFRPLRLLDWHADPDEVSVHWTSPDSSEGARASTRARLLVLADGRPSRQGSAPPVLHSRMSQGRVHQRDYAQTAVVTEVETDHPHDGCAWERFTPAGPLALLPHGAARALIWSVSPDEARALCSAPQREFLQRLQLAFGHRLGRFTHTGERFSFPLSLSYAAATPEPRVVAIGNAAQTLHPVAGQGLNLGLRDAWELAELIERTSVGSLGGPAFAREFQRRRLLDRRGGIGFTDTLVRVFSNPWPMASAMRGAGLAALDIFPPARRFLAQRMMYGARAVP